MDNLESDQKNVYDHDSDDSTGRSFFSCQTYYTRCDGRRSGNCADCHIGNDYSSFLIILGYQKSRY